jgi:hypothetical protein
MELLEKKLDYLKPTALKAQCHYQHNINANVFCVLTETLGSLA